MDIGISKNEMNRDSLYTFTPKDSSFKGYINDVLPLFNKLFANNLLFNNYQAFLNSLFVLNNLN